MNNRSDKSQPLATAGAIGGKMTRACDSCIRYRASCYCAADDAFLCDPCDSLVHSANPLARRHHRLRLKSFSTTYPAVPTWHHGFKRKPRTPRLHQKPLVPELDSSADDEVDEEEDQLLYRMPVFDPALAFGGPTPPPPPPSVAAAAVGVGEEFGPTEMEMADFVADMESLLGRGLEDGEELFTMAELGIRSLEMTEEVALEDAEVKENEVISKGMGLRLDYEAVIEAWLARGGSPWISGEGPRRGTEDCWLQCMGMWGGLGVGGIQAMDVGREARVTRYREKRRTRLYSKKIRYEVRKLNAEKRPRMKGRFVKRTSFRATVAVASTGGVPVGFTYGKR